MTTYDLNKKQYTTTPTSSEKLDKLFTKYFNEKLLNPNIKLIDVFNKTEM